MKIFLAGATGAVGRSLIPQLTRRGHTVVGTTRSQAKAAMLRDLGAEPVLLDGLDRDAVIAAVVAAAPDAIVHQTRAPAGRSRRRPIRWIRTRPRSCARRSTRCASWSRP